MTGGEKTRNIGAAIVITGVLILIGMVFAVIWPSVSKPTTKLTIGDGVFVAALALTESDREKGLSGVADLSPNEALLMAFPSDDKWGIWMKDMDFPIDIIWLDDNKEVVYITPNVSPESATSVTYKPDKPARYVIELPAGTAESKAIRIGTTATFQIKESDVK